MLHRVWHLTSCSWDGCSIAKNYIHTGERWKVKGKRQKADFSQSSFLSKFYMRAHQRHLPIFCCLELDHVTMPSLKKCLGRWSFQLSKMPIWKQRKHFLRQGKKGANSIDKQVKFLFPYLCRKCLSGLKVSYF